MKSRVDHEERRVLAEARAGLAPTREQVDRILAATHLQLQHVAPTDPPQLAAAPVPLVAANSLVKRSLAVFVCLVAAGGLSAYLTRSPQEPHAQVRATATVQAPSLVIEPASSPCTDCVASAEAPAKQPRRVNRGPLNPDFELDALRRVERALRENQPRRALALLRELDRRVPHGQLREERFAAISVARCMLDAAPKQVLRAQFTARYPDSVYLARVEQSCTDKSERDVLAPDK